jgi:hypothetical protein
MDRSQVRWSLRTFTHTESCASGQGLVSRSRTAKGRAVLIALGVMVSVGTAQASAAHLDREFGRVVSHFWQRLRRGTERNRAPQTADRRQDRQMIRPQRHAPHPVPQDELPAALLQEMDVRRGQAALLASF